MTPRQFLQRFNPDDRLATGRYFPSAGLALGGDDHVGVVLFGLGGPNDRSELEPFLYSRWMDPVLDSRGPVLGRHGLAKVASRALARFVWQDYEEIGGECPANRLVREQASALQEMLNERLGPHTGAKFSTYISMRHGSPSSEDALAEMRARNVSRIVLVPLYPQYSMSTTGTSLAYWSTLMSLQTEGTAPVSAVLEYSAHPKYLQAVSERMDQALQRFPKRIRRNVEIVFCAEHASTHGPLHDQDSLCELAHTTVSRLATMRNDSRPYTIACFCPGVRQGRRDQRDMRRVVQRLVTEGAEAVLVVPLGVATDDVWTTYTLDILLRQTARELGVGSYEVASGLNCHPLFIASLAEMVGAQFSDATATPLSESADETVDNSRRNPVRKRDAERSPGCPTCHGPVRAHEWGSTPRQGKTLE